MTRGFFVTENPLRGFPVMFGSLLRAGNVRRSEHFPHWHPEMYFAPGTRPGAKCFLLVGITVCGEKQKPRDDPRFCNKKKGKENEKDEG